MAPLETSTFAWSQIAPNAFSRQLDTTESFYHLVSETSKPSRDQWAITLSLRLSYTSSVPDLVPYLRLAWLATGKRHRNLASIVTKVDTDKDQLPRGTHIMTVGAFDPAIWLQQTFFQHDTNQTGESMVQNATRSQLPSLHWLPSSHEICFHSSHWRIDGIGMLMLANSYMSSLATALRQDLDSARENILNDPSEAHGWLTPSLDELLKSHPTEEATPNYVKIVADDLICKYQKGVPSIGLPVETNRASASPTATYRTSVTFDNSTTSRIIDSCKTLSFSVSAAVQGAAIRAAISYKQHPMARSYTSYFPTNLRQKLSLPWNSEDYAVGLLSSGLPLLVENIMDGPMPFEQIVSVINAAYKQDPGAIGTDQNGNPISQQQLVAPFIRRTVELFSAPSSGDSPLPPITSPDVSNLGKVEKYIKREYTLRDGVGQGIQIDDMWMMVEVNSPAVFCHQWTFRDRLTLQASVNEAYYDKEFMQEFIDKTKTELLIGLKL